MKNQDISKKGISRRGFLKMLGGFGTVGATAMLTGCQHFDKAIVGGEGWIPKQYQRSKYWPAQVRGRIPIHPESVSIDRNDEKCILCGQCIEACRGVQSVFKHYELPIVDDVICVDCGQCIMWCPTKSITEKSSINQVMEALEDPNKFVVVQTAPATRVALGEEFGLPPGTWVQGQQVAALKELGFDRVFDTSFGADLTIMEESKEFYKIVTGVYDRHLPLFTSCCPAWVKFCEYYYPDLVHHISSCGSPMQMVGATVKTYYAKLNNIDPEQIYTVAIMPCTAKKAEAKRPEMNASGRYWRNENIRDTDAVLTVRELAQMMKSAGIDVTALPEKDYDPILGKSSGGGLIFGATGGVMEACMRTAYYWFTKQDLPDEMLDFKPMRGLKGIKEASVEIPGVGTIRVAVVHGLGNTRVLLDAMRRGEKTGYHIIEVMACPGGCIGGGGQPRTALPPNDKLRQERIEELYEKDASMKLCRSHRNPEIKALYENFYEKPGSKLAYKLLHPVYPEGRKPRTDNINITV